MLSVSVFLEEKWQKQQLYDGLSINYIGMKLHDSDAMQEPHF